jgi:hypothetical protein
MPFSTRKLSTAFSRMNSMDLHEVRAVCDGTGRMWQATRPTFLIKGSIQDPRSYAMHFFREEKMVNF